ncbi:MAG: rplD [Ilumatobacteraceae bacterium]|nr:rplD [Ilumatobacteraceae bacterium]
MPSVTLSNVTGKGGKSGTVELDADVFGTQPNVPVMHQVVTAQLAHRRAGTQSTKTRAEVSGGGKKPFKQKGTGNARQGSTRAPHFSGGGVALGPKPRKYSQKTPKKMIKLALRSALSDRANEGKVVVVDSWGFDAPSTKAAVAALGTLGITGSVLVVHGREDVNTVKSFRNLGNVQLIEVGELNAYDVLCNETIVFTSDNLPVGGPLGKSAGERKTFAASAGAKAAKTQADGPNGPGSHAPLEDASVAPEGFEIKGNAQSNLYHVPGSRYYKSTVAEVWFATEAAAEAAGFSKPGAKAADAEESDES